MQSRYQTKSRRAPDKRTKEIRSLDINDVSVRESGSLSPPREKPMVLQVGMERFLRYGYERDIPVIHGGANSYDCDCESHLRQATAESEDVSPSASHTEAHRVHWGDEEYVNSDNLLPCDSPRDVFIADAPLADGSGWKQVSRLCLAHSDQWEGSPRIAERPHRPQARGEALLLVTFR